MVERIYLQSHAMMPLIRVQKKFLVDAAHHERRVLPGELLMHTPMGQGR
jgi:hypothetical protein